MGVVDATTNELEPQLTPDPAPGPDPETGKLREAVARLEAHLADVRIHAARLEAELEARRQEAADEREAHHRQVQLLMMALYNERPALPSPSGAIVTEHPGEGGQAGDNDEPVEWKLEPEPKPARRRWWQRLVWG